MVFTYSNLNEYKRYLCHSFTFPIAVFVAAVFRTELPLQLHEFAISVSLVAMAVLPLAGHHIGEIISKAIINMFVYIPGTLLGYGLRRFSKEGTGRVILLAVLFIPIALGIFVRSVIKVVKDGYEYAPTAFLVAMFLAFVDPLGPDLQTNEFDTNIKTLVIAYSLTIFLAWCLSFFAGDEVHYRVQEIINDFADIFKELDQKCFGQNSVYKNLQDESFLELLQSLINSKEKEKSLSKFLCWELRWHPHRQEQYENIGDLIRHWAFSILSLSTTVENLHLTPHLRETCKEICSESAKALALLSDSMKNKIAPAASIDIHLTKLQNLANNLKENPLEFTAIHLGQVANDNPPAGPVGNSETQREEDNLGQEAINVNPPAASIDIIHLTRLQNLANHLKENTLEFTAVLKLTLHPDNTLELTAPVKLASHPENKVQFTNPVLKLALHPENTMEFTAMLKLTSYEENIHIISHLLTSVNFIEKLASSIKELAALVPFKQSEHDSNLALNSIV